MGAPVLVSRWLRDRAGILISRWIGSQLPRSSAALWAGSVAKNTTRVGHPIDLEKGENQLQFKIKDQDYFLAFVEQEKRWYLFAPTEQGVHRIPVYVDAAKYEKTPMLGTETLAS